MSDSKASTENDLVLRVKSQEGLFHVRTDDFYVRTALVRTGAYSPAEVRLLSSLLRNGDVAIDIGAHIGLITVPLARSVGKEGMVLAFEPQQKIFQLLCANLVANGLENVQARCAAVGAAAGRVVVETTDNGSGNLGERRVIATVSEDWRTVSLISLDSLGLSDVQLLKIDVEGFELAVLDGAAELLNNRPMIYAENQFYLGAEQRENSIHLLGRLLEMDYKVWWHCPPLVQPSDDPASDVFSDGGSVNVLAVPKRHARRLTPDAERIHGLTPIHAADSVVMPDWMSLRAIVRATFGDRALEAEGLSGDDLARSRSFEMFVEALRWRDRAVQPMNRREAAEIAEFVIEVLAEFPSDNLRFVVRGVLPPGLEAFLSARFTLSSEDGPAPEFPALAEMVVEEEASMTRREPARVVVLATADGYVIERQSLS
jgi:FkbM family methyltransferase